MSELCNVGTEGGVTTLHMELPTDKLALLSHNEALKCGMTSWDTCQTLNQVIWWVLVLWQGLLSHGQGWTRLWLQRCFVFVMMGMIRLLVTDKSFITTHLYLFRLSPTTSCQINSNISSWLLTWRAQILCSISRRIVRLWSWSLRQESYCRGIYSFLNKGLIKVPWNWVISVYLE